MNEENFERAKLAYELIFEKNLSATKAGEILGRHRCNAKRLAYKYENFLKKQNLENNDNFKKLEIPKDIGLKTYILTSAQNNIEVNDTFFKKIMVLKNYLCAELLISPLITSKKDISFDSKIHNYIVHDKIQLCKDLIFCANHSKNGIGLENPLSGFKRFLGRSSLIFPSTKFCLESVATENNKKTKFLYTTGICTKEKYADNKTGLKAKEDHAFGCLVVQINSLEEWTVHQVEMCVDTETLYWKDICIDKNNNVTKNNFLKALVLGDNHFSKMTNENFESVWGLGGLVDITKPEIQVHHDFFDGKTITRHNIGKTTDNFSSHHTKKNSLWQELVLTNKMLKSCKMYGSKHYIVQSNHDDYLEKFVNDRDYKTDPENALVYLMSQTVNFIYHSKNGSICNIDLPNDFSIIAKNCEKYFLKDKFLLIEYCFREWFNLDENFEFINVDSDVKILGTHIPYHGDIGVAGSKGSFSQFANLPFENITGHTHVTGIRGNCYSVGVLASLEMGYNRGASAWSISHCGIHPNGKKVILTKTEFSNKYFL